jgi:hypothetical protein
MEPSRLPAFLWILSLGRPRIERREEQEAGKIWGWNLPVFPPSCGFSISGSSLLEGALELLPLGEGFLPEVAPLGEERGNRGHVPLAQVVLG